MTTRLTKRLSAPKSKIVAALTDKGRDALNDPKLSPDHRKLLQAMQRVGGKVTL
jgi:hypothetical protein